MRVIFLVDELKSPVIEGLARRMKGDVASKLCCGRPTAVKMGLETTEELCHCQIHFPSGEMPPVEPPSIVFLFFDTSKLRKEKAKVLSVLVRPWCQSVMVACCAGCFAHRFVFSPLQSGGSRPFTSEKVWCFTKQSGTT